MSAPDTPTTVSERDVIRRTLENARTIAVVGLSTNPAKPSAIVATYLKTAGYKVIPVHPTATEWQGQRVYAHLTEIPDPIDIVDVFRPAADCLEIAQDAVAIGAKTLWLQLGIANDEAAAVARAAGLTVIMNRCTEMEHVRLAFESRNPFGIHPGARG